MKASSRCNFPRACNSSASTRKMPSRLPSRTHGWKRRWQVRYDHFPLGIGEFPSSSHGLLLPVFILAENS